MVQTVTNWRQFFWAKKKDLRKRSSKAAQLTLRAPMNGETCGLEFTLNREPESFPLGEAEILSSIQRATTGT
jgi:hypothetical protein